MKKIPDTLTLALFFLITQVGLGQQIIEKDYKAHFNKYNVDGCFVLYDQNKNEYIKHNDSICNVAYLPASTFKVPNSVIALEEEIVSDIKQVIKWDGIESPHAVWNKDQTLETALKYSCVWAYVGFAEQIGIEKYQKYLSDFNYGNKDLSGPPNHFWLQGPFSISANQQIEFLKSFYNYDLPVSKRSIDLVKSIMVMEETETYTLSAKTGGTKISDSEYIMWLIGYVEKGNNTYFFTVNFTANDFNKTKNARYEIVRAILESRGIID